MDQQIPGQTTIEVPLNERAEQMNFLDVIDRTFSGLGELKIELKIAKEKLDAEMQQHGGYLVAKEDAKASALKLKEAKEKALQSEMIASLTEEVKDLQTRIKEKKEILSDVAVGFTDKTGKDYVDLPVGRMFIKRSAKLVKAPKN